MSELQFERWVQNALIVIYRELIGVKLSMAEMRDNFEADIQELAQAITGLADRIRNLPDADAITQSDLDRLKEDADALNQLAVANPDVPTSPDSNVPSPDGSSSSADGGTPTPTGDPVANARVARGPRAK